MLKGVGKVKKKERKMANKCKQINGWKLIQEKDEK